MAAHGPIEVIGHRPDSLRDDILDGMRVMLGLCLDVKHGRDRELWGSDGRATRARCDAVSERSVCGRRDPRQPAADVVDGWELDRGATGREIETPRVSAQARERRCVGADLAL